MDDYSHKSTVEEIRQRFDNDVERFSNLDTGQISTVDAQLSLEMITETARRIKPNADALLDIGCGAGNYTVKMLGKIPTLQCTLIDLSEPMLKRAAERITPHTSKHLNIIQGDIREIVLENNTFDIILAGAVLHHLRDDEDWRSVFAKLYAALKNGGCLIISDMVKQSTDILTAYMWQLYGEYLESLQGKEYRDKVIAYVEKEDSPRSIMYQLELMKSVGFRTTDVLHKHYNFAAYLGIK